MSNNIAVVAEARQGALKKTSLEAVAAALELAGQTGGQVIALLPGANLDAAKTDLAASGAHKVVAIEGDALANYSGDGYCRAVVEALADAGATAVVMAHTAFGKDLAPRVAAALQTSCVSDATAVHFADGKVGATKPIYAGKAYAKYMADKSPLVITVRPNNFEPQSGGSAETSAAAPSFGADELKAIVTEIVAGASDRVPLQEASVVVSGGRGLKEAEHFKLIEDLAAAFGPGVAAVGASRAVVDAGWRPHREQVGQTGKVVAPPLYFACGVSGAIQHLAGMSTSKCIVAINKDPEAPIFKVADYGIVGDVFEVLPALTEAVKAAVAH